MSKNAVRKKSRNPKGKNNALWIAAVTSCVMFLFLVVLIGWSVSASSAKKRRQTMPADDTAVNVEREIPATDMGDLIYHEPAAENVVMQGGFGYVNNELLVTLDSSESLPALKEYLAGIGGEVVGEIPLTADYQIMLSGTYPEEELVALTEQVKSLPYVERSSLNYAFEVENTSEDEVYYPNDKKWDSWKESSGNNWNMKAIEAPGAWAYRYQMVPVNVGVIEGMFDFYHEDLTFNEMPLGNVYAIGPNKYAGHGWWTKEQNHGTHVAGIIGADFDNNKGVCGVAPNAKLYGANWKYEDKEPAQFYYTQKVALFYLVHDKKCRVINLSYCLGQKELMYSASKGNKAAQKFWNILNEDLAEFLRKLDDVTENSFIICKSANNDNDKLFFRKDDEDIKDGYEYFSYNDYQKNKDADEYKKYKDRITKKNCVYGGADAKWDIYSGIEDEEIQEMIIVIGAVSVSGQHSYLGCKHAGYKVAEYSNRGNRVDVLAPGGNSDDTAFSDSQIYSTVPDGIVGYGYEHGTSMATPHVAGVAAMIFGIDPTFTAKEVKDIIVSTATGSYENGIGDEKHSCGLLNAKLAVEEAIRRRDEKAKQQKETTSTAESTGEHRYEIYYDTLTWEEAKAACEAKGGHLATITSEKEQYLLELCNDKDQKLWIGGYKNADGQWCWVTGEPWEYENWGEGEPNNSSNVVAGENCAAMWPRKWNDLANSNVYEQSGYICEWEAPGSTSGAEDDGYTGHRYEFYSAKAADAGLVTWEQAKWRCEWKGGHLAVIESQAENDFLYSEMKKNGYENAYFGYSDKETKGTWKWVNDSQSSYTNWHSDEPNNQGDNEDYAMFYQKFDDGTWNDGNGNIDTGCVYICEWDDPSDKDQQGDVLTDRQLKIIAADLGVPDSLDVEIRQAPSTYWDAGQRWLVQVEVGVDGMSVAWATVDPDTGEMISIWNYDPDGNRFPMSLPANG